MRLHRDGPRVPARAVSAGPDATGSNEAGERLDSDRPQWVDGDCWEGEVNDGRQSAYA